MNSTYVQGIEIVSVDALQEGETAWLNGSLLYPFGKNLTYTIGITFPEGSLVLQVLSDGNFTIHDNTVTWNAPIDQVAVQFMPPNVEIIDVTPSKTIVGQNSTATIDVEIVNHSFLTQSFNVTVYANDTFIELQTITLTNGTTAVLTFTWNTTGFAFSNYTLSAFAEPVPDETYILDNNMTIGTVYVGVPGDVDGNRIVNMLDLYKIALDYGATIGQPNYVPNYDVDGNGIINMLDLYIAALHFGETEP